MLIFWKFLPNFQYQRIEEKIAGYNKQQFIRQVAHISNHVKNLLFDAIINLGFGRSVWMSRKGENECEYNK